MFSLLSDPIRARTRWSAHRLGLFNNNAFTMAVGAAVADLVDDATLRALNERGDRLREALNTRFTASPLPFTTTGWGSLLNVHPVRGPIATPDELAGADGRWRELLFHDLLADGFYLAPRLYIALTLDVDDDDTGRLAEAVSDFCERRSTLVG